MIRLMLLLSLFWLAATASAADAKPKLPTVPPALPDSPRSPETAPEAAPEAPRPPETPETPRRPPRRGPDIWAAYSTFSEAERQELNALQAKDPDAFRRKLTERAEELRAKEQREIARLNTLLNAYRLADPVSRKAIEEKITEMVRASHIQKLEDNRRHLEGMRQRIAQQEADIRNREANLEPMVKATVEILLQKVLDAENRAAAAQKAD